MSASPSFLNDIVLQGEICRQLPVVGEYSWNMPSSAALTKAKKRLADVEKGVFAIQSEQIRSETQEIIDGIHANIQKGFARLKPTIATIFSGFGGVEAGAVGAGLMPIWAIESDKEIATVFRQNHQCRLIEKDVRDVNPDGLDSPNVLWCSPPCQNWSIARSNRKLKQKEDAEIAMSIIPFLTMLKPEFFILENVSGFRKSKSYFEILLCLSRLGYFVSIQMLDAADFGVPQHRKRLILIAKRGGLIPPTFGGWAHVSWYDALGDMIADLPKTELTPSQHEHVRPEGDILISHGRSGVNGNYTSRLRSRPSFTITCSLGRSYAKCRVGGKIRNLTPRAIARLQSFDDGFILPEKKRVAFKGLGNAVPPLFVKRLLEGLMLEH